MPPQRGRRPPPGSPLPVTARLHRLIEWLRTGAPLTTTLAAAELGVSRRTVMRDLHHLRDVLCLKVRYDPARGTYELDPGHAALPFLPHPDLLKTLLNGSPRAYDGSPGTVHVRFSARSVRSYEAASGLDFSPFKDGEDRLDVAYTPPVEDDFVRWVLSCGAEAEVLGPHGIRCRVQMEIQRMLEVYEPAEKPPA